MHTKNISVVIIIIIIIIIVVVVVVVVMWLQIEGQSYILKNRKKGEVQHIPILIFKNREI